MFVLLRDGLARAGAAPNAILTISIEKQRKCSPFFFIIFGVRMGELREARIPMRPAIGVLLRPKGYIFNVLA